MKNMWHCICQKSDKHISMVALGALPQFFLDLERNWISDTATMLRRISLKLITDGYIEHRTSFYEHRAAMPCWLHSSYEFAVVSKAVPLASLYWIQTVGKEMCQILMNGLVETFYHNSIANCVAALALSVEHDPFVNASLDLNELSSHKTNQLWNQRCQISAPAQHSQKLSVRNTKLIAMMRDAAYCSRRSTHGVSQINTGNVTSYACLLVLAR